MNGKKYFWSVLITTISLLAVLSIPTIVIDPLLYFHKPLKGLCYPMRDEFYLNPGIVKHYEYDAVLVGDSSAQNFLTSEMDERWGINTVKLTNQGAPYKETDRILRYALKKNDKIKMIFRPFDVLMLSKDADLERYDKSDYYMMNDNPLSVVKYLFNIDSVKKCYSVIKDTKAGKTTWNMDMYSNWEDSRVYGSYEMLEETLKNEPTVDYSDESAAIENAVENVRINVVETARMYPDKEFVLFMPPYHMAYYKTLMNAGTYETEFKVQKAAIEEVLSVDNIKLYSFMDDYDIITDWSLYCDMVHSRQCVNSRMTEMIFKDEHRITKDNYIEYLKGLKEYTDNFDYESLCEVKN